MGKAFPQHDHGAICAVVAELGNPVAGKVVDLLDRRLFGRRYPVGHVAAIFTAVQHQTLMHGLGLFFFCWLGVRTVVIGEFFLRLHMHMRV